jgi:hypothetical protein
MPVPGETALESVYEPLIQQLQLSSAPALLPCRDDEAVRFSETVLLCNCFHVCDCVKLQLQAVYCNLNSAGSY